MNTAVGQEQCAPWPHQLLHSSGQSIGIQATAMDDKFDTLLVDDVQGLSGSLSMPTGPSPEPWRLAMASAKVALFCSLRRHK